MLGILFGFLLIFGGMSGDLSIFNSTNVPWVSPFGTTVQSFGLWAWFIGYVFLILSAVLLIIGIAFGSIKGPKIDTERLNELMRQYVEESTKTPPPTPPSG
jgi:hypothetical protein